MNKRLITLDALRGLAALVVLLFHFQVNGIISSRGYLAVDFFFLLSGLVIARTYDGRMSTGLTFSRFAALRLIRIYPLFAVGLLIGFARWYSYIALNRSDALPLSELLRAGAFEVFLLPSTVTKNIFLLNGPSWSLFFEMAVNLLYAAALARASVRLLALICAGFAVALAIAALMHGTLDLGFAWETFYGGIARTCFSFTLGMLIARLNRSEMKTNWIAIVPMVVLVACLMAPPFAEPWLFDLFVVMVVSPTLVWIGASVNPPALLQPASKWLGDLSYPVYAIHYPLMFIWLFFAKRAHWSPAMQLSGFILLVVVLAWLLNRFVDLPVRRWLTSRLEGSKRSSLTQSSA